MNRSSALRKTRSQRIKEHRAQRIQRAIDVIEGRDYFKPKMSRTFKIMFFMLSAILIYVFMKSRFINIPNMGFSLNEYETRYEQFLIEESDNFIYDKNIKEIIRNNDEYSIVQNSTKESSSLIAMYGNKKMVSRLAVVGKLTNNKAVFLKAFGENVIFTYATVGNISYDKALQDLQKIGFIDEDKSFIDKNRNVKVNFDDLTMMYFKNNENYVLNIENKN